RLTQWSGAGNENYTKPQPVLIDVTNLGALGNGIHVDDTAIIQAIDSLKNNGGGIVYLPSGTYLVNRTITLYSNIVLRGAGSDNTILRCNLGGVNHAITASGSELGTTNLTTSHAVGDTVLNIGSHSYVAGEWLRVSVGDSSFINDSWSSNYLGQIVRIDSVTSSKLFINKPLRFYLSISQVPKVRKMLPQDSLGIEDMRIVRNDVTSAQTANINFSNVINSWIIGVESDSCNYSHVSLTRSAFNQIQGCYFRNAHSYGGGGKGYGIAFQYASGDNVITNNILQKLRHAILFQACANGNVVSYNYSREPYWSESFVPSDYTGDVVMHGNYPYMNLIEGNIFQNLRIDASHGKNGNNNVFLRNRIENFGIIMSSNVGDSSIFLGNEITGTGSVTIFITYYRGSYILTGNGNFEYNNNQNGTLKPTGSNSTFVSSYYLLASPSFWVNAGTWPTLGGSNSLGSGTIPAEYRYVNNSQKTVPLGMGTALPVTYLKVGGEVLTSGCRRIFWTTASEQNNSHFVVERFSENGPPSTIYRIDGSGNSNVTKEYQFLDCAPSRESILYYQISQVDFDGKTKQAPLLSIPIKKDLELAFYPNPTNNYLYVSGLNKAIAIQFRVLDDGGRILLEGQLSQTMEIDLSGIELPTSFLVEIISSTGKKHTARINRP
ncbi:MAG: hypothetical protein ACI9NN_001264, partial [Bacteroidia bacterium]